MTQIAIPAALSIRTAQWSQTGGIAVQTSEFTGREKRIRLGPAGRWTCEAEIVSSAANGFDAARVIRGFLAAMAAPDAFCLLPATETPQVTVDGRPPQCQANGGPQLGFSLNLKGLAPSVTNLRAGDFITVLGNLTQLFCLTADLVANSAGEGVATFAQPLRGAVANDDVVLLSLPVAKMSLSSPLGWVVSPGAIYDHGPLTFRERF
ncbi:MAG: hypothetical protein MUE77_10260 [Sandarakinorhabdus sp.]|jgi:hypothetical protein|nr:hypothetical protein [Sandarakinorhabdus sp.]